MKIAICLCGRPIHCVACKAATEASKMKFNKDNDSAKLKSGTAIYANKTILGISARLEAFGGYDGYLTPAYNEDNPSASLTEEGFTEEDRIEIATEAIRRWTAWMNK